MRWMGLLAAVALVGLLVSGPSAAQSGPACPWMDASKEPRQRANELLAAMSLDDKLALVSGSFSSYGFASQIPANDALCIPQFVFSDGPAGIAGGYGGTQTGVTAFPVGMSQAATFDVVLQERLGEAMATEALGKGANVLLAPATNINRVPMNGRNFEYFGEDPFLAAETSVAEIRGIQQQPVVATVKHYALNSQEIQRMQISAEADERTTREIYLPAFEASVKRARVGSVMCAYNRVGGTYACEHPGLLNEVLKEDWGFDGWVMSDWGATHSTVPAALAGLDQEQNVGPGGTHFREPLREAVESGQVPAARLDDMVMRILHPSFRLGLFDHRPAEQPAAYGANVSTAAHRQLAREIAEEGSVLLKNADSILPLDRLAAGSSIALIGRPASAAGAQTAAVGSGSAHVNGVVVDPHQAIQARATAQGAAVTYAAGDSHADAAAAAAAADVAVVFVRDLAGEGNDRPGMGLNDGTCVIIVCGQLPTDQNGMIAAVAEANPNTVVVLLTSGPVAMPWLDQVKGVLEVWWPGTEYGTAVASLLFGDTNPSGKLPQTFPKALEDLPTNTPERYPGVDGKLHYSEGLEVGYRWFDARGIEPLFPFGFGLSYSSFDYSRLRIAPSRRDAVGAVVRFHIANTGDRAGAEVGQVYVGFPRATGEPPKQLKGFDKLFVTPGSRRTATIRLDDRAFSFWSTRRDRWQVARGCYRIMVGRSSRQTELQGIVAVNGARCRGAMARLGSGCLARRSPIGPRNIGRVRLGYNRRAMLRRVRPRPGTRTRRSWRWCVKRTRGRVSAVFGRRRRVELVVTNARGRGNRGVRPGARASLLRFAYPHRTRLARGVFRVQRRSARIVGVRRGRVRFVGVASRRLLRRPRVLRRQLRLAGV